MPNNQEDDDFFQPLFPSAPSPPMSEEAMKKSLESVINSPMSAALLAAKQSRE